VEVERLLIVLPPREHHEDYVRRPIPTTMIIPEIY
jgi:hypothetical protein